jgi:hypothetical protein
LQLGAATGGLGAAICNWDFPGAALWRKPMLWLCAMAVNATHPDYDAKAPEWSRARDVLAGEDSSDRFSAGCKAEKWQRVAVVGSERHTGALPGLVHRLSTKNWCYGCARMAVNATHPDLASQARHELGAPGYETASRNVVEAQAHGS